MADTGPAHFQIRPNRLTDERTLLVSGPHFALERIDLAPNSAWCLEAKRETWILVLSGGRIAEQGSPEELMADPDSHFAAMLRADSAFALAV